MKVKEGDIFTIPISDKYFGLGQVVYVPDKNKFMIIVFENKFESLSDLDIYNFDNILLFGYTMDAKLYHGHWKVIDNKSFDKDKINWPLYKLGTPPDNIFILDYKGNKIKEATIDQFNKLNYLTVVAPVRFENALKAFHNEGLWNSSFDKIHYKV